MIYKIEISESALEDMKSIYKYIAFDLASPNTALGQITRMEAAIKGLSQMPERF